MASGTTTGRFAPSPTGQLHAGSLIAAVASRCQSASWRVRIDDIDAPRTVAGSEAGILGALERFGFTGPDAVPERQSEHHARHLAALERLAARGLLFACRCSRRSLAGHDVYPGTCRRHSVSADDVRALSGIGGAAARGGGGIALRVRLRGGVAFDDRVQGGREFDLERDVGDTVVRRRDGIFAYHLATAVDDSDGIDEVVRGADLLDSTPVQIALMRLLDRPEPSYAHVPVAIDALGRKLGKSTGAAPIDGVEPDGGAPRDRPARLELLRAVWAFLGQPPLAAESIPAFWQGNYSPKLSHRTG